MKPGMDDTTPYSHAKCTACNEENTKTVPDMPMWTVNIKDLEVIMMTEQKNKNQELGATQENTYTPEDIEKNKTMAGLAYLLFFLPLIACPESRYAKFHANQALLLLITGIVGNVILGIIPVIGWMLMPIFGIGVLILGIMGLVNGFGGKAKQLPLIGKFTILK
ncbi:MAG: hypothetical protein PHO50_08265 [Aminobacterium colombiense]|nr:hypothetical protein [Aminobacterium colombiense]